MRNAVVDTNVLVSGLLRPDHPPGRIVDMILSGDLQPVFDDRILAEYRRVLARPRFGFKVQDVADLMDYVQYFGWGIVAPVLAIQLPDPNDVMFLEAAAECHASLITGNLRHFPRSACSKVGVQVFAPVEFLASFHENL